MAEKIVGNRKIGLASRRLAPPPTMVSVDPVVQRDLVDRTGPQNPPCLVRSSNSVGSSQNIVIGREAEPLEGSTSIRQQNPPISAVHRPIPRSAATCVSKRQRLQAEFHDRTKDQIADFFAQRSLEADRLPRDQARYFDDLYFIYEPPAFRYMSEMTVLRISTGSSSCGDGR